MSFLFPRLDMLVPWRVNNRKVDHKMEIFCHNSSIYVFWDIPAASGTDRYETVFGKLFQLGFLKAVLKNHESEQKQTPPKKKRIFKAFGLWHVFLICKTFLHECTLSMWCWKWIERDTLYVYAFLDGVWIYSSTLFFLLSLFYYMEWMFSHNHAGPKCCQKFPFKPFAIAVGWVQHSTPQPFGL